jgi:hypothetical protein
MQSPAVSAAYQQAIKLAARYGESRVVNMDETSWRDVQCRGHTIARRGQRQVGVTVKGNMKAAVSAICTMGKDGRKFPPLYVLRATSANARTEPSPAPLADITVSENGWVTQTVMLWYLMWLTLPLGTGPLALVLSTFPGHLTGRIRRCAKELGVQMIEVSKGMTDLLQPLDRSCFGPLKRISEQ